METNSNDNVEEDELDMMMKIQQDIENEEKNNREEEYMEDDDEGEVIIKKNKKKRKKKKKSFFEDEAEDEDDSCPSSSEEEEEDKDTTLGGFIVNDKKNDDDEFMEEDDEEYDEAKEIGNRREVDFEKEENDEEFEEEKEGEENEEETFDESGKEEEEDINEEEEEEEESTKILEDTSDELYNDSRNSNNMSRSMKVVDPSKFSKTGKEDGTSYVFISEAEGPMLSSMSKLQILLLLHVINSPIHRKHIAETSTLKPTFNKNDGILEKLMEEVETSKDQYERSGMNFLFYLCLNLIDQRDREQRLRAALSSRCSNRSNFLI